MELGLLRSQHQVLNLRCPQHSQGEMLGRELQRGVWSWGRGQGWGVSLEGLFQALSLDKDPREEKRTEPPVLQL